MKIKVKYQASAFSLMKVRNKQTEKYFYRFSMTSGFYTQTFTGADVLSLNTRIPGFTKRM